MKDWTEQVLTAAATIGIVLLFVLAMHRPRQRALQDLRGQTAALEQKLTQAQQACAVLMPLTRQVQGLRACAGQFDERLPQGAQAGPFLQQLAEHLRQSQLSSLEMRPALPVDGPRYTELPIKLGFEGTFPNIYSFLAQLEGLARTKRIVELNLTGNMADTTSVRADMLLSIFSTKG